MKRKNAFTLVELLAVITILGLIALIAVPAITNIMSKQKEKVYYDQLNQLIMASKNWGTDNLDILRDNYLDYCNENDFYTLELDELQNIDLENNVKYLDDEFINPKTDKNFSNGDVSVHIYKRDKAYLYCVTTENCTNTKFVEHSEIASSICCDGSDFKARISCVQE